MNYYFLHFQHDNAYLRGEKGCPEVFAGAPVDLAEWKVPILSITDGSALLDLHGSSLKVPCPRSAAQKSAHGPSF